MKITKNQLRKIIREEYENLPQAGDPAEAARLKAQRDAARVPDIETDIKVPVELFDRLVEFLEDISDSGTRSGGNGPRARDLLLKLERETGAL